MFDFLKIFNDNTSEEKLVVETFNPELSHYNEVGAREFYLPVFGIAANFIPMKYAKHMPATGKCVIATIEVPVTYRVAYNNDILNVKRFICVSRRFFMLPKKQQLALVANENAKQNRAASNCDGAGGMNSVSDEVVSSRDLEYGARANTINNFGRDAIRAFKYTEKLAKKSQEKTGEYLRKDRAQLYNNLPPDQVLSSIIYGYQNDEPVDNPQEPGDAPEQTVSEAV